MAGLKTYHPPASLSSPLLTSIESLASPLCTHPPLPLHPSPCLALTSEARMWIPTSDPVVCALLQLVASPRRSHVRACPPSKCNMRPLRRGRGLYVRFIRAPPHAPLLAIQSPAPGHGANFVRGAYHDLGKFITGFLVITGLGILLFLLGLEADGSVACCVVP
jgi:hypothetical protein